MVRKSNELLFFPFIFLFRFDYFYSKVIFDNFVTFYFPGDARIVGGETAKKSYPYQISLQIKVPVYLAFFPTGRNEWTHNCGGAIVSPTCVLTAAHCVVDYKPADLSILAGTNKLRGGGGTRYMVTNTKAHPNYKELVTSDIAVMKINGTFNFTDKIQPIKYSKQEIGGGVNCTLTGWGYTTPIRLGTPPNELQVAVLPTITNSECRDEGMKGVNDTEICTFSRIGQGACGVSVIRFCFLCVCIKKSTILN